MSTKIINVLTDDKFEDILKIFKNASATEVIFVLPRKSRILNNEDHFARISEAAEEQEKTVLLLASSPEINSLAGRYNIGVLISEKNVSGKPKSKSKPELIAVEPEPEPETETEPETWQRDDIAVLPEDDERDEEKDEELAVDKAPQELDEDAKEDGDEAVHDEEPARELSGYGYGSDIAQIELAVAKKPSRMISDIVLPPSEDRESVSVRVAPKEETSFDVGIKKAVVSSKAKRPVDDIENIWQYRPNPNTGEEGLVRQSGPVSSKSSKKFSLNLGRLSNLNKQTFSIFAITVVVLFGIVMYVSMGSARIIVKPRVSDLDFFLKVSASDQFSGIDSDLKTIPGQFFSIEKIVEETFQSTGERDVAQKARGKIIVYNEYGTTPQLLIATTRFESVGGLIFRTLKTITVPGTTVQNGKITPGKTEVEVIADKAGDNYNIAAGRFTIPAFKEKSDTDRYQKFYGISEEQIKGGIVGKAKVVTEKDYADAKKKIEERLMTEAGQEFTDKASGLKILDLASPSIGEVSSTAKVDEATDEFTMSVSARLENIGFRESDLNELIAGYVGNINDLSVLAEKLKLEFKDVAVDKDKKILTFNVKVGGPAYGRINNDQIISELAGKNEKEIKEYVKGKEGIASARVILSPFWVRKVPKDTTRIKLELDYQ